VQSILQDEVMRSLIAARPHTTDENINQIMHIRHCYVCTLGENQTKVTNTVSLSNSTSRTWAIILSELIFRIKRSENLVRKLTNRATSLAFLGHVYNNRVEEQVFMCKHLPPLATGEIFMLTLTWLQTAQTAPTKNVRRQGKRVVPFHFTRLH